MCAARLRKWIFFLLQLAVLPVCAEQPAVAVFYGGNPPWDELRAFDVVVVEPDQPGLDPVRQARPDSAIFAYASVGEVNPSKPYYSAIPPQWLIGSNAQWGSRIIDQAQPEWPAFFVEKVLAPLWQRGYRGFFLDTLDSWQMVATTPAARARQIAGLTAVIRAIKARWPDARLIFNRGFEILPQVHAEAWMVAAESLFQSYDPQQGRYLAVTDEDRAQLLRELRKVQQDYRLPVLVIDYVPAEQRALARRTAADIRALGFIPWVSTPALDMLGVGAVEVLPRRVVVVYDPAESDNLQTATVQRTLGIIFAYLGLVPEYRPLTEAPPRLMPGRYAGVVLWMDTDRALLGTPWPDWLAAQIHAGLPLAVFGSFGVSSAHALLTQLELESPELAEDARPTLVAKDDLMGFEMPVRARPDVYAMRLRGPGRALLTLQAKGAGILQPAALTSWGGYVLAPYVLESLPGEEGERWIVNPLGFLRAALRIDPAVPVPDVTTENGRRLFFVHIDGDGFASQAEQRDRQYAGEVLRDEILRRYHYPTSASIIEGEVGAAGLYPQLSSRLEAAARDIFALPWVEVASHTYSHPFVWSKAEEEKGDSGSEGNHLDIKGYRFSLQREITGSRDYIDSRLAPRGKPTRILFWSGDCVATPAALAEVERAGLLNMNGGDTTITRNHNSWTRIAGLGLAKGEYFQIFAPNQNENVYTHDWTGPFYAFDKALETFELTDHPYRFKPVDLYYHVYSATKPASLAALHRIYAWVEQQPLHPIFASDYVRKVLDFNRVVVARTPQGFRVRGDGELRTLRIPVPARQPDWLASRGVVGMAPAPEGRYLSLAGGSAELAWAAGKGTDGTGGLPYLAEANARLTGFVRRPQGLRFGLSGRMPLEFALAQAGHCQLRAGPQPLSPQRVAGGLQYYRLKQHDEPSFELDCRA